MYIIDIIPLANLPSANGSILSYFHSDSLPSGATVEVLYGRRTIIGIVFRSDPISKRKTELRKSVNFELKGIKKVIYSKPQVSDWQLDIAKYISEYYFAPFGVCLKTVLPPFWNQNFKKKIEKLKSASQKLKIKSAQCNQTFLLVAENTVGQYYMQKYKDQNPIYINSKTKIKEYKQIWQHVQKPSVPDQLVIGTRVGLFLPFANLTKIIIDDPDNNAYKSDMLPRYNGADLAKYIAKLHKTKIKYVSIFPSLSLMSDLRSMPYTQHPVIIDMVREIKDANFSIFSRAIKSLLYETVEKKQNLILYIPRRGHANFILCQTCSKAITCPDCSVSLTLHETYNMKHEERNTNASSSKFHASRLICHHCPYRTELPKQCPSCQSYTLKPHGVGSDKVMADLKKYFEYQNLIMPVILQLDSDVSNNDDASEKEIIRMFINTQGTILVTTQIIFSHRLELVSASPWRDGLPKQINIGIINADVLIKIPDYKSEELLMRQLYMLSTMTSNLMIQTYNPDNPLFVALTRNELYKWMSDELKQRHSFKYPPYSQLIKLTFAHKDSRKSKDEAKILYKKLQNVLSTQHWLHFILLPPFPAFISKERGKYIWNILIKIIKHEAWNMKQAKEKNQLLQYVPQGWSIDVDPKSAI